MAGDDIEKPASEPAGDSEPVPKLPRNRGIRLTGPEMFRIVITGAMLVTVLILAKPCGNAVSNFVMGFEGKNKGSAMPKPGNVDLPSGLPGSAGDYVELHAGMTDEQIQQAIAQARAKHAAASGSAASGSAASGSAAGGSAASGSAAGGASAGSAATGAAPATGSAASSTR